MIIQRFDGQVWKVDLFSAPNFKELQWFVNKKSLPLVSEATEEVMRTARMTMQPRVTAYVRLP